MKGPKPNIHECVVEQAPAGQNGYILKGICSEPEQGPTTRTRFPEGKHVSALLKQINWGTGRAEDINGIAYRIITFAGGIAGAKPKAQLATATGPAKTEAPAKAPVIPTTTAKTAIAPPTSSKKAAKNAAKGKIDAFAGKAKLEERGPKKA